MNQTTLDLFIEYKNELAELIFIAESSPQRLKDSAMAQNFNREFDRLVALTNLFGRLLVSRERKPANRRKDFRKN